MRQAGFIAAAFCAVMAGCASRTPAPCLSFTEQQLIYRATESGAFNPQSRAAALKKISCETPGTASRLAALEGRPELVAPDTLPLIQGWTGGTSEMSAWASGYAERHQSATVTRALAQHVETTDHPMASALFALALRQGSVESAHDLAFAFLHGWDRQPKSAWAAYYWYHHAARRGIPESLKACVALEEMLYAAVPTYVTPCKAMAMAEGRPR